MNFLMKSQMWTQATKNHDRKESANLIKWNSICKGDIGVSQSETFFRPCFLKTIYVGLILVFLVAGCSRQENEQLDSDLNQARSAVNAHSGGFVALIAGYASIREDIAPVDTDSFTCTPLYPLKKGQQFGARLSGEEAWSVETCSVQAGSRTVELPIISIVKSDDTVHTVFPATFKPKVDIAAGRTIRSNGYTVVVNRAIKAGESIAVLDFGDGMFSVETSKGVTKSADEMPSVAVLKTGLKPQDRILACEAWLKVISVSN